MCSDSQARLNITGIISPEAMIYSFLFRSNLRNAQDDSLFNHEEVNLFIARHCLFKFKSNSVIERGENVFSASFV